MVADVWIACVILLDMDHMWTDHTVAFKVIAITHQTDTVVKVM